MKARKVRLLRVNAEDPAVWAMLVNLDSACFLQSAPPLTDNEGQWWVAKVGDDTAGYCAIRESASSKEGAYLSRCGVLPRFRGKGLQKKMLRIRIAHARRTGFKYIVTDTCDNPASGNSLIACGFRMITPSYKWSFDNACYWRKAITPSTKKATPNAVPEKP